MKFKFLEGRFDIVPVRPCHDHPDRDLRLCVRAGPVAGAHPRQADLRRPLTTRNNMTNTSEAPDRAQWLRLWSALPAAAVKALAADLAGQHRVEDLALPQSGLGLLPLTDSAPGRYLFHR